MKKELKDTIIAELGAKLKEWFVRNNIMYNEEY